MKKTADLIDIKRYLPHRHPMLMVDIILEIEGDDVVTSFEIKADNIFIENSLFTESGLIENMAQTCSSLVAKDFLIDENNHEIEGASVIGFISGIKTLKINTLPKVGTTIHTKATLKSKFLAETYTLCAINCKTYDGEELLLEGEINLYIQENNSNQ